VGRVSPVSACGLQWSLDVGMGFVFMFAWCRLASCGFSVAVAIIPCRRRWLYRFLSSFFSSVASVWHIQYSDISGVMCWWQWVASVFFFLFFFKARSLGKYLGIGRKPETIDYGSARAVRLKDFSPFCTVGSNGWWLQRTWC